MRKAGQISHAISSAWFDRFIEAYDREFDRFFANIEADRQPGGKEATAWDGYVANVVADAALDSLHHGRAHPRDAQRAAGAVPVIRRLFNGSGRPPRTQRVPVALRQPLLVGLDGEETGAPGCR